MFKNISSLYYYQKKEKQLYTRVPGGEPDIDRLTANKPAWKKEGYEGAKKKKTLVITDFTLSFLNKLGKKSQYLPLKENIEELLKKPHEFEIYISLDTGIEKITLDNIGMLNDKKFCERINPLSEKQIKEEMYLAHELLPREVQVLDTYNMRKLDFYDDEEVVIYLDEFIPSSIIENFIEVYDKYFDSFPKGTKFSVRNVFFKDFSYVLRFAKKNNIFIDYSYSSAMDLSSHRRYDSDNAFDKNIDVLDEIEFAKIKEIVVDENYENFLEMLKEKNKDISNIIKCKIYINGYFDLKGFKEFIEKINNNFPSIKKIEFLNLCLDIENEFWEKIFKPESSSNYDVEEIIEELKTKEQNVQEEYYKKIKESFKEELTVLDEFDNVDWVNVNFTYFGLNDDFLVYLPTDKLSEDYPVDSIIFTTKMMNNFLFNRDICEKIKVLKLKVLENDIKLELENLETILSYMPNVKEVILFQKEEKYYNEPEEILRIENLGEYSVDDNKIGILQLINFDKKFSEILSGMPVFNDLKKIVFSSEKGENNIIFSKDYVDAFLEKFPEIEEIEGFFSVPVIEFLNELSKKSNKLKRVNIFEREGGEYIINCNKINRSRGFDNKISFTEDFLKCLKSVVCRKDMDFFTYSKSKSLESIKSHRIKFTDDFFKRVDVEGLPIVNVKTVKLFGNNFNVTHASEMLLKILVINNKKLFTLEVDDVFMQEVNKFSYGKLINVSSLICFFESFDEYGDINKVKYFLNSISGLKEIDFNLNNFSLCDGEIFDFLKDRNQNIKKIKIRAIGMKNPSVNDFFYALKNFPFLEEINFYGSFSVENIKNLGGQIFNNLKKINIMNDLRPGASVASFYKNLPKPRSLNEDVPALYINFLIELINRSPNLEKIFMNGFKIKFKRHIHNKKVLKDRLLNTLYEKGFRGKELDVEASLAHNYKIDYNQSVSSDLNKETLEQDEKYLYEKYKIKSQEKSKENLRKSSRVPVDKKFKETNYNLQKIFYSSSFFESDPDPTEYRNIVYDSFKFSASKSPFILTNSQDDLNLIDVDIEFVDEDLRVISKNMNEIGVFYGGLNLDLSESWLGLPSLTSSDKILKISGLDYDKVEVKYSKRDNLYYIRSKKGKLKLGIEFLVKTEKTKGVKNQKVLKIINKFKEFYQDKETISKKMEIVFGQGIYYEPEQLLNKMIEEKLGSCVQRSIAFKYYISKIIPGIEVNIITNDAHAFVEILEDGLWHTYDLGGYPANVDIHEPKINKSVIKKEKALDEMLLEKGFSSSLFSVDSVKEKHDSILSFTREIVSNNKGKRVLVSANKEQSRDYVFYLEKYCKSIEKPFLYIDSPDDMHCLGKWLDINNNEGIIRDGPGGEIYDFLIKHKENAPLIVVNWNNFDNNEVVKFNSILDDYRVIDSIEVPSKALVLGVYDTDDINTYKGADFYSRNDLKEKLTFSDLSTAIEKYDMFKESNLKSDSEIYKIELFNSDRWRSVLLGHWVLKGKKLFFEEGELLKAIKTNKDIKLVNAPWNLQEFKDFYRKFNLYKGFLHQGKFYSVANDVSFATGYYLDINLFKENLIENDFKSPFILNNKNFSKMFRNYNYIPPDLIYEFPGVLQDFKSKNKVLNILVTDNLNADKWMEFLVEAQKINIKLNLKFSEGIKVPSFLIGVDGFELKEVAEYNNENLLVNDQVIISSDVDFSCEIFLKEQEDYWHFEDISEFDERDILGCISGSDDDPLNFKLQVSDVLQKLLDGKNVILKGTFSKELEQSLASLLLKEPYALLNGEKKKIKGKLVLISDKEGSFRYVSGKKIENHSLDKKIEYLKFHKKDAELLIQQGIKYTISELRAIQKQIQKDGSLNAWYGLETLEEDSLEKILNFSISESEIFQKMRKESFYQALHNEFFCFIAGLTGVGKTTFMQSLVAAENEVFMGYDNLVSWAKNTNDKLKILFIDEANISDEQYMKFEGLFKNPPMILVDGKFYELTDKHKIVFAGNPLSYGGERTMPRFFQKHGANSIIFKSMPAAYLHHNVTLPVLDNLKEILNVNEASKIFIKAYQLVASLSLHKTLITARELKMMCLKLASLGDNATLIAAKRIAYNLTLNLFSEKDAVLFKEMFKKEILYIHKVEEFVPFKINNDFLLTKSRELPFRELSELLSVREFKRKTSLESCKYGGLAGLVLEGEPGTGKSHFVISCLLKEGYKNGLTGSYDKLFYHIPVGMKNIDKEKMLLKAFDEGAVVVMDELNTSMMNEQLLNGLLMGEYKGKKPTNPGFTLIASQNSAEMGGRNKMPEALKRRLTVVPFESYSKDEMLQILIEKGMPEDISGVIIEKYIVEREKAISSEKEIIPVFRDVVKVVNKYIEKLSNDIEIEDKIKAEKELILLPRKYMIFSQSLKSDLQQEMRVS